MNRLSAIVLAGAVAACGLTQGKTADQQICDHAARYVSVFVDPNATLRYKVDTLVAENTEIARLGSRARSAKLRELAAEAGFDNGLRDATNIPPDQWPTYDLFGQPSAGITKVSHFCNG